MLVEPDSRLLGEQRATIWAGLQRIWAGVTPQPPRDFVAFVADHLGRLRQEARLLADDEYEAHELYSQALIDIAIRWHWFALLRRLTRHDTADAYLHETLIRRSVRLRAEQAELARQAEFVEVEFDVWFSDDPEATYPPPGRRRPPAAPLPVPQAAPTRSGGTPRMLPMSSLRVEVGPVAEAAVAWWHAYVAHRYARLGAIAGAIVLVMVTVGPYLQRH
jgi:hypothetical protein